MKYQKQEKFPPFASSGEILKSKKVAVIGLGGLGSHSSELIARMGVGSIVLVEDDIIEESNLPRQGLYTQSDSDEMRYKVEVAYQRLKEINPSIDFTVHNERLTQVNAKEFLKGVDLVLDGTDNMATRYIINQHCFQNNIPWVYAAATASVGVISNYIPGKTPCLRCVYGEMRETETSCDINGIILPALTMITSLQVTEAMKILLGKEPSLSELRYNIWTREETSISNAGFFDEDCPVCQEENHDEKQNAPYLHMICSGDSIQVNTEYSLPELSSKLSEWGFCFERAANKILIERYKKIEDQQEQSTLSPRIVAFKNGKVIFHHVEQEQIKKWLA